MATANQKPRILILGSGWGGYILSRRLDPSRFDITVLSPRSYFVFTPLLNDTATGELEFPHVVEPVRNPRSAVKFVQGWARNVDLRKGVVTAEGSITEKGVTQAEAVDGKEVDLNSNALQKQEEQSREEGKLFDVPFDKLVIAVGCNAQTFGTPGVKDNALFLKDVGDARKIRRRILECFELAAAPTTTPEMRKCLLNFAVVGGGPTGTEFAAVLADLIQEDLIRNYPHLKGQAHVTVYDVAPRVLSMFDETLAKYASTTLEREGVSVKTDHHIQELRWGVPGQKAPSKPDPRGCLTLKSKEEGEVGIGMCVWSTGNAMNSFITGGTSRLSEVSSSSLVPKHSTDKNIDGLSWEVKRDKKTRALVVDNHLRVQLQTNNGETAALSDIFALGDNCMLETGALPATAQTANQEAIWLAKSLNKGNVGNGPGFQFKDLGVITYLGDAKGLVQRPGTESDKASSLLPQGLKGRTAWLAWKGAYLTMSVSWRNRVLILVYWFVNWVFGKDISRF